MNCNRVSQQIGSYLDGEMAGPEMLAIRNHLHHCAACAEEAESLRSLKSALSYMPACEPPADLEDRLLAVIRTQARPMFGRRKGFVWGAALTMAAAGGFVFAWFAMVQPQVSRNAVAATTPEEASFELSRDQAYQAASDPLSGHSMVVTASYGGN